MIQHRRSLVSKYSHMERLQAIAFIVILQKKTTNSDDQLVMTLVDFGFPPFSALSQTMTFMVQLVCHKPEIQRKIQEEIDQVIGEGRMPTLDDRVK